MKNLFLTLLLLSCAKPTVEPVEPETDRLEELQDKIVELIRHGITLSDNNGWLVSKSCDSMLWTGKFGTAIDDFVNISAAEKPGTGKFYRTPAKTCFEENRSGSTWSRDMSLGLLAFLLANKDLETIDRHISFGEANGWVMGEGAKSRTVYSPALIGLWYKAAKFLGHDYKVIIVPNEYTSGKTDFTAHLQMMDIYINGEIDGAISDVMLARINEHSDRIPSSLFYKTLKAKYDGDVTDSVDLCLDDSLLVGDYVRCDQEECELAERIFACGILTKFIYDRSQ